MMLRLATEADLEAMTAVLVWASPLDPVYPYRFPDRELYPDEFAALCRRKCAEYLETSTVVVCEMPVDPYRSETQVVAFSAWDMPSAAQPERSRRASAVGNLTRQSAFRTALAHHKSTLFDSRYRPQGGHVFLKILLCHPSYQRRGAGTALTSWGIEQARRLGVHTTVFASPMGLRLYKKLGFREVGTFRVQPEGDREYLEIPALALGPGYVGGMREAAWFGGGGVPHLESVCA
ncbi:acyl-CoA N-acyltransferase [Chaetomium strumarium]|uniref:Acyl-CoA N-acyltransferase n=1 Tax=Chaetomium strumarium TaxID=1170767 RepID=A0AAJ0GRG6_9PEZI|nr:acyl-CoA N-acyltransferase [Chaetomium strumarium]